jgi:hypothetical protein
MLAPSRPRNGGEKTHETATELFECPGFNAVVFQKAIVRGG